MRRRGNDGALGVAHHDRTTRTTGRLTVPDAQPTPQSVARCRPSPSVGKRSVSHSAKPLLNHPAFNQSSSLSPPTKPAVHSTYPVHKGAADRWRPSEGTGCRSRVGATYAGVKSDALPSRLGASPKCPQLQGACLSVKSCTGRRRVAQNKNLAREVQLPRAPLLQKPFGGDPREAHPHADGTPGGIRSRHRPRYRASLITGGQPPANSASSASAPPT